MSYTWAPYQSATGCTRYGPAGAQALMTYLEDYFPGQTSLGICACRAVVGGSAYSHHAECRAYDAGYKANTNLGVKILQLLGPHGKRLGLDHMIVNHNPTATGRGNPRIYTAQYPNGTTYTGTHPHKDHNHIGLTRAAGRSLTYATIVQVVGKPANVPKPPSPPVTDWTKKVIMALPTLKKGDGMGTAASKAKAPDVKRAQGLLLANGFQDKNTTNPRTACDGQFGSGTETAVKNFQKAVKLTADGIVGQGTWTKLLGE